MTGYEGHWLLAADRKARRRRHIAYQRALIALRDLHLAEFRELMWAELQALEDGAT